MTTVLPFRRPFNPAIDIKERALGLLWQPSVAVLWELEALAYGEHAGPHHSITKMARRIGIPYDQFSRLLIAQGVLAASEPIDDDGEATHEPIPMRRYIDNNLGFSILLPAEWNMDGRAYAPTRAADGALAASLRELAHERKTTGHGEGHYRPGTDLLERRRQGKAELAERIGDMRKAARVEAMTWGFASAWPESGTDDAAIEISRLELDVQMSAQELYELSKPGRRELSESSQMKSSAIHAGDMDGVCWRHGFIRDKSQEGDYVFFDGYFTADGAGWDISCSYLDAEPDAAAEHPYAGLFRRIIESFRLNGPRA